MSDTARLVLIILGMVAATFVSRYPVLYFAGRGTLPDRLAFLLRYVPPAVLISIIAPSILYQDSELSIRLSNEYLAAALVTSLVGWRTRRMILSIVAGMVTLWAWRLLLAGIPL
jgi:branched-subunit amino acid transport protein